MKTNTDTEIEINRPDVVAEVRAAFEEYERALSAADVAVLTELIWNDARVIRYGITDQQHGAEQIATWRRAHPTIPAGRRRHNTQILTLNDHTAVVNTLFDYPDSTDPTEPSSTPIQGRQTQTWARFTRGSRNTLTRSRSCRSNFMHDSSRRFLKIA
jgi:hypothetical protein